MTTYLAVLADGPRRLACRLVQRKRLFIADTPAAVPAGGANTALSRCGMSGKKPQADGHWGISRRCGTHRGTLGIGLAASVFSTLVLCGDGNNGEIGVGAVME